MKIGDKVRNTRAFDMFETTDDNDGNWNTIRVPVGTIGIVKEVYGSMYNVQFPQREEVYSIGDVFLEKVVLNPFVGGAIVRITRGIAATRWNKFLQNWETGKLAYPPKNTVGVVAYDLWNTHYSYTPDTVRVKTDQYPDGLMVETRDLIIIHLD